MFPKNLFEILIGLNFLIQPVPCWPGGQGSSAELKTVPFTGRTFPKTIDGASYFESRKLPVKKPGQMDSKTELAWIDYWVEGRRGVVAPVFTRDAGDSLRGRGLSVRANKACGKNLRKRLSSRFSTTTFKVGQRALEFSLLRIQYGKWTVLDGLNFACNEAQDDGYDHGRPIFYSFEPVALVGSYLIFEQSGVTKPDCAGFLEFGGSRETVNIDLRKVSKNNNGVDIDRTWEFTWEVLFKKEETDELQKKNSSFFGGLEERSTGPLVTGIRLLDYNSETNLVQVEFMADEKELKAELTPDDAKIFAGAKKGDGFLYLNRPSQRFGSSMTYEKFKKFHKVSCE